MCVFFIGYLVSKLAQMCFEKNLFQMAIVFYKIACLQLNLYVNSDNSLKQTRMDEVFNIFLTKIFV